MIPEEFKKELQESEFRYECRKTFVSKCMKKYHRVRSTIFEWIRRVRYYQLPKDAKGFLKIRIAESD